MRPARGWPTAAGAVLRAILALGGASRSVVAAHAGLSPATVTSQTRALIEAGLLRESPPVDRSQRVGRPHSPLELDRRNAVAAIHFAATQTRVAVVDIAGTIVAGALVPHRTLEGADLVADAAAALAALRRDLPDDTRLSGVGVATGGWVDPEAGVVLSHPLLRLEDTLVRDVLVQLTGLPVELDSHARAMVHAEQLFGALDFDASAAVLFVGNVIDAAFAVDGRVHYGPGSSAGSLATLVPSDLGPGGPGPLDTYSDRSLERRAAGSGIMAQPTIPALIAAAETDPRAHALFEDRARGLAVVAAALLDVLNPETLIITDRAFTGLPAVRATYFDAIAARAQVRSARHRIIGTSFPNRSLETAAAAVLLHRLYADPLAVAAEGFGAHRKEEPAARFESPQFESR
ncbi:ROK family transcriptional regulator [Nocardia cerradoensis]|uniref:N-acetylglucosamine repressor n=1 Tax=Nocardia cerradoensis TaxID=85688 RepID=A0A231HBX1_9NOCA|nr:ROK family transcriptional regulator [Nocardia cerradoensis]NKY46829.1 ROK family protein [Nocardia cerradoensis]OXR46197.1 N-acetylglucosamine repressor [Nocardia cerradoensis]